MCLKLILLICGLIMIIVMINPQISFEFCKK